MRGSTLSANATETRSSGNKSNRYKKYRKILRVLFVVMRGVGFEPTKLSRRIIIVGSGLEPFWVLTPSNSPFEKKGNFGINYSLGTVTPGLP